jgi:glutathione synthase/RimK-type ligase-like ATP-grasp enzyme
MKPVWSSGGARIAVTNQQGGSAPESIQILNVATGTAETIYIQRFLIKEKK